MKKLILILTVVSFAFTSCNRIPEGGPSGEQSIETAPGLLGEKVLIRLKPKVGDTQNLMVTLNMKSEDDDEMNVNMISKIDMAVVNREDSVFTYEMKYKSIKMNIRAGVMEMEFDSDSKEQNPMGSILSGQMKGLLENPVLMKMDQMGRVLEFKLPGNFTSDQTGDLGSVTLPLPEHAVGVGDSWTADRPLEGLGNMEMNMTLEKITVDYVQIKTTGFLNKDDEDSAFEGTYKLDRKTGFTKDGLMKMKLSKEGKKMDMTIEFKSI